MKQEEKKIYDFKKGDEITRLRPIIYEGGSKDYSFVGKKIQFLGIANASVYLAKDSDFFTSILTGKNHFTMQIPLEICEDGWAFYVTPDFLDEHDLDEGFELTEEEKLEYEIMKATETEEYEKIAILKKKLDNLKEKKDGSE